MTKSDQVLLCGRVVEILCEYSSVIKRHELLPSVIWNNNS